MKKEFLIGLTIFVLFTSVLFGHGIKVTVEKKSPCIIVKAQYHGSRGLADAEVTVRFENETKQFQKGNTDKNGNFCLYPDKPGKWTVTVDDGMGHLKKKEIVITDAFFNPPPKIEEKKTEEKKVEVKKAEVKKVEEKKTNEKDKPEEKKPPYTESDMCCYLLKIVGGALLILLITFILHRLSKQQKK